MKTNRIAYCIPALYNSAGMERVLTIKANFLATHGYEVHIVITDGGGKEPAFPLESSIQIHQLNIGFEELYRYSLLHRVWLYKQKMRIFRKELDACLNKIKPDITISLLRRDINIINRMTDGSVKIGEIHFDRLHYRHFNLSWLPDFICRWIQHWWMSALIGELKKLSRFVVLTHEDAANWPELKNVVVIPNPSSFFPSAISNCTSRQIIAAGRYVPQKGFDRLIAAWGLIADKYPGWKLKIYGDGWLRTQLEQQILDSHLQDSCSLEFTVSNLADKMQESSIFVLSSRFEGFGLVLVEAMSCGLPCVSFACQCGPRDIISDGKDGFLVQDGDIGGLANRISELIADNSRRQQMGEMAREKAKNYQIENIGMKWIALFEQVTSKNK